VAALLLCLQNTRWSSHKIFITCTHSILRPSTTMPAMHSHATGCLPREGHVLCVALLWERSGGWEAWTFQKLEPSILIEPNEKVHSLHLFLSHTMQYVSQEIHGTARSLHVLLPPTNHVVRMRRKQEETEEERMKKNRAGNYSVGTETHEH